MKSSETFDDRSEFINTTDFPYVTPFSTTYPVRRKHKHDRNGLLVLGFVHDGASGDLIICGKRISIIRDLSLFDSAIHDQRYLLGGDIVLPEGTDNWRDGDLIPVAKLRTDYEYAKGLMRKHRYKESIIRFLALRTSISKKIWKEKRADSRLWRVKLYERMIPFPNSWAYNYQTWKLCDIRKISIKDVSTLKSLA